MQKTQRGGDPQEISQLIEGPRGRLLVVKNSKGRGKKAPKPPWARFKASVEWIDGNFWTGPSLDYSPRSDLRNDPTIIRILDENLGYNQLLQCLRERSHRIKKAKIWAAVSDTYTQAPAQNHNICVFSWTKGYSPMIRVLKWEHHHNEKEIIKPVKCLVATCLDVEHLSLYPPGSINPKQFWR